MGRHRARGPVLPGQRRRRAALSGRLRRPVGRDRRSDATAPPLTPAMRSGLSSLLQGVGAAHSDAMTTDRLGMTVLSTDECYELLRGAQVGRLAVSNGVHPDIFPINYVLDGKSIVFRTAEGTKLAASVLTPAVAFEADGVIEASDEAWSVVVKGRAREVESIEALLD